MVIEIPIDNDPSDATIIYGFPIEEEITSPKIQQPQQEPETDPMVRTRKQPTNVVGNATIPSPRSRVVPTPSQRSPTSPVAVAPAREQLENHLNS